MSVITKIIIFSSRIFNVNTNVRQDVAFHVCESYDSFSEIYNNFYAFLLSVYTSHVGFRKEAFSYEGGVITQFSLSCLPSSTCPIGNLSG